MRSGRVVHIVRRRAERLDAVLDVIATTLDIHIRIDETVRHILGRLQIGNSYVNRGVIVLSVGVQPSAAKGCPAPAQGPRPRYLHRFATERTMSIDTTAAGGNASLLSLQDEG